jgi:hypothetical protein
VECRHEGRHSFFIPSVWKLCQVTQIVHNPVDLFICIRFSFKCLPKSTVQRILVYRRRERETNGASKAATQV